MIFRGLFPRYTGEACIIVPREHSGVLNISGKKINIFQPADTAVLRGPCPSSVPVESVNGYDATQGTISTHRGFFYIKKKDLLYLWFSIFWPVQLYESRSGHFLRCHCGGCIGVGVGSTEVVARRTERNRRLNFRQLGDICAVKAA